MSEYHFFAYSDFEFHTNRSENLVNLPISRYQATKQTTTDEVTFELDVPYTVFEVLVAIFTIIGNLMVIIVFQRERKLRRRTNYYIVSLAMADFLVGALGIPFAILASIGKPTNLIACLFTVSLLVVLCTISIFCLVAVSVDRYWAILYPMAYSRNVRTRTAIIIISLCWVAGAMVGFLPLFGWHAAVGPNQACLFVEVMDYSYLVFLYFATILTPALLMLAFYAHIYRVIVKQVRQIVTMNPVGDCSRRSSTAQIHSTQIGRGCHGGTMLRVLGAARKRDVKATQNLSIIVLFFMICWMPLYTINCILAFCPDCYIHPNWTLFGIILSHLNSAVNPVLYAYHLKDFRSALKNLILKVIGVDVEPNIDAMHRFSVASQHRLQSMDVSMRHNSLAPRIYVDSPIWLRQQQQSLKDPHSMPKCGIVSPCLTNSIGSIHQTVAAVASMPTDIEREMWSIMEASSGAELGEIHYEFPDFPDNENSTPIPPKRRNRQRNTLSTKTERHCDSPYLYDNQNYSTGPEDDDDVEYDDVFLPPQTSSTPNGSVVDAKKLNDSLIACAMREKLRIDDVDYQNRFHTSMRALTDSSHSDYEHSKPTTTTNSQSPPNVSKQASLSSPTNSNSATPTLKSKRTPMLARAESLSQSSSSNTCLANSTSVYIIDEADDKNPLSPGNKPKFRKTPSLQKSTKTFSRTCTYSDSSAPQPNSVKLLSHSTSSNSSSTQSISKINANGNSHNNNNNNNSQTTNNLNYYTIHNSNHQSVYHQTNHSEKFSPFKAMSNLIFPPIVKHSSLFHLFQPSSSSSSSSAAAASAAAANGTTITSKQHSADKPNMEESVETTTTSSTDLVVVDKPNVTSVVSPTES